MIQLFPDLLSWAKDTSVSVVLSILLGYILLRLLFPKFSTVIEEHSTVAKQISELYTAELEPKSPPEQRRLIPRHEILERIKDLEEQICARHGMDNCPVLPIIDQKADDTKDLFIRYMEEAKKDRQETQQLIREIFESDKQFYRTIGVELVHAARERIINGKRSDSGSDPSGTSGSCSKT